MLDRLKSLPLTIILTILIWMYAEAQFTATEQGLPVTVRAISRDTDSAAMIVDPANGVFRVSVEGSRGQVDRFREGSLGVRPFSTSEASGFIYYPPAPAPAAVTTPLEIESVQILNSLPYFRQNGLTVTAASPAMVRVDVDRMRHVRRPITWRGGLPAVVTPQSADVIIPQHLLDTIGGEDKIKVYASPSRDLSSLPVDTQSRVPVDLTAEYPAPTDSRVSLSPSTASALVTGPRTRESTMTIRDVPILVSGSPDMLSKVEITLDPRTITVKLAGPEATFNAMRADMNRGQPALRIYLDIDDADKPGNRLRRTLRYALPEGVVVSEGPQTVQFSLKYVTPPIPLEQP